MAKLTDLPTEILETIFREFLSKELTDHGDMCRWLPEEDARRTRATLYSLSMVSKAMSKIALPLLYEQLFDWNDVSWISSDNIGLGANIRALAYTRYLSIPFHNSTYGPEETRLARLQEALPQFLRVKYLRLDLRCSSTIASALLLCLASLSGFSGLQNLDIDVSQAEDKQHTLFRDVCHFSSISGLLLYLGDDIGFIGFPAKPLKQLKFLEVSYIGDEDDLSASMALATPRSLQKLSLPDFHAQVSSSDSLLKIFGEDTWTELEEVELPSFATASVGFSTSSSAQFSRLRRLHLRLTSRNTIAEVLPTIPAGLVFLEILHMEIHHLKEALDLIAGQGWPGESLRHIELDLSVVEYPAYFIDLPAYPQKRDFLEAARNAMSAAEALNIVLEPKDLVTQIARLEFWRNIAY